ncbi:hypothetical protein PAHAL_2G356200 [Panicum hallii]|uniref:KIB1-4 beta-propeller domain-containing protein n=1 Tax=Panicum hallii TaxID=206008 RepID=A0A2T8KRJ4_9POAL|nr:uncharacterized protein LOC112880165 isoform X2 [Panicum hallii]PVH64774.1 hypothetical protein PAHAL_2G356200 [Panicum hallii]PVH64776.1 hypothetical protein PAHAL_2G356200 [Panicum hallii]PVH64780.1 hypothetical protein PAHAL_2G356200 [Panicum hallii]
MADSGRKRQCGAFATSVACKRRAHGRDWTSLPSDITNVIAERLLAEDVVDYMSLRSVCAPWRASTASPRDPTLRDVRFRPRGWVALCDGDGVRPADACQVNFFHTSTSRRLRVRLPELHDHRIVGFTDGLLILLNKSTTAVRVLHPFTRVFLDLPPLAPVFHLLVKDIWSRAWMEAAVCWSCTSIAVVAWFPNVPVVVHAEPTRPRWCVIYRGLQLWTALPFQGRLFGIRKDTRQIIQLYPHLPYPVVACIPNSFGRPNMCDCYLVDFGGRMLLTVQHRIIDQCLEGWQPFAFAFFLVNVHQRELVPVDSLGDRAIFLNKDRCLCVSAKDLPSISGNSVYFSLHTTDPVAVHSLSKRTCERTSTFSLIHNFKERIRPSVRPFTLADHLLSYCHHVQWSKGFMFHEYFSIPASWKKMVRKLKAQDQEIQVPFMIREKTEGRLRSSDMKNSPPWYLARC